MIVPLLLMPPAKVAELVTRMALGERPAPTEIVPLLVMPPAELLPNWVTPLTTRPAPAVMLPLLLISPAKITMSPTKMPSPLAEIVPPLLTPPVKVEKLDINAARPRRNRAAIGDAAREDRAAIDENAVAKRRDRGAVDDAAGEGRSAADVDPGTACRDRAAVADAAGKGRYAANVGPAKPAEIVLLLAMPPVKS